MTAREVNKGWNFPEDAVWRSGTYIKVKRYYQWEEQSEEQNSASREDEVTIETERENWGRTSVLGGWYSGLPLW